MSTSTSTIVQSTMQFRVCIARTNEWDCIGGQVINDPLTRPFGRVTLAAQAWGLFMSEASEALAAACADLQTLADLLDGQPLQRIALRALERVSTVQASELARLSAQASRTRASRARNVTSRDGNAMSLEGGKGGVYLLSQSNREYREGEESARGEGDVTSRERNVTSVRRRKTQVPPRGEDEVLWAKTWKIDHTHREFPAFLSHWRGTGKPMLDWHEVWLNWVRRAPLFQKPLARGGTGSNLTHADEVEQKRRKEQEWEEYCDRELPRLKAEAAQRKTDERPRELEDHAGDERERRAPEASAPQMVLHGLRTRLGKGGTGGQGTAGSQGAP